MVARARTGLTTMLVAVTTALLAAASSARQDPPAFKVAMDVVTIHASVRDPRGHAVKQLRASDFEVLDNGQKKSIIEVRSDVTSPVSLAILFDVSGSMSIGAKIPVARDVFETLLSGLHPGDDEASLFTFDSELHERHGFTADPNSIRDALPEIEAFGSTSLYDATAATARRVAGHSSSRGAIVVLTDGIDTSSALSPSEVSALASSIDVPVYIVAVVPAIDRRLALEDTERTSRNSKEGDLRDLADWTGGTLTFVSTSADGVLAASNLLTELRQQYVIAIAAAETPGWRPLDVRARNTSLIVKARSGYFGGGPLERR